MASKETAVGKGDAGENALDRRLMSDGWIVKSKSTRSMVRVPNFNKSKSTKPFIYVQKIVDLFNAFDRIYVKNDNILFAQVSVKHHLAEKKHKIEKNFPVVFTLPNMQVSIFLWYKEMHGKVERYEFERVDWNYSKADNKMVWSGIQKYI